MPFEDVMRIMLPPQNGIEPHVTANFGERRTSGPHGGTDFNYEGGQSGLNMLRPAVHSPIAGEVVFSGGQYGTVKIRDADGNTHEILHMDGRQVEVGDQIEAGDPIGTLGGRGPNGASHYARHVHYQMKDSAGNLINPQAWWDARVAASEKGGSPDGVCVAGATDVAPVSAGLLGDSEREIRALAERHALPWDQGMVNTVWAAALCARQAGLTEINLANVRRGDLLLGQHDGLTLREVSLDARKAANTPQQQSMASLEQWDHQMPVSANSQERPVQGAAQVMAL
ncbi:hypothetical protein LPB72_20550 [Hydrogenophaga crassostreae]|uniref:M23ase beta-sheet core domain-containing protein n=1 Tax=Hydrogenophaga crassostreae TaxID=1763535 RepID=A0A167GMF8_9BURK|nr:M23 family metallopeptidase [Hydrogenophaga crassostreae]AOW14824.1 hypothetical protein LPB072_20380 [Hydrogenophaga crassostreae]OAD39653.1 hypothetical protein LPB72_20550 [Hydrogenophaga crassostreae]